MISKVAVLMPCYNTEIEVLNKALECVHNQTAFINGKIKDYTIFLVNDGSDIDYSEYSKDPNIYLINLSKNKKISYALNVALMEAKEQGYKWAFRMDSNDVCDLTRFEKQLQLLEMYPDTHIIGTQLNGVDKEGKILFTTHHKPHYHRSIDKGLTDYWIINHATALYNIHDILELGGYDIYMFRKEDIALWEVAFKRGYKFRNVNEVLYSWIR